MPHNNYDLIVIGAGSGGLGAASGMLQLGFKVLLIDRQAENIGGECLNTGCVPSKALLHVAKQVYQARMASRFGLEIQGSIQIEKVKDYILEKQASIRSHEHVEFFREKGMDVVLGTASFVSPKEIQVNGQVYTAKNFVIATGSSPRKMDIKGSAAIPVFTHESIFNINFIPGHFVFIGAGPVSMELCQAFSRLGSKVSVVIRGKSILKREDQLISAVILKKLQQENIDFYFETEIREIENGNMAVLNKKS